jgi:hypothetical protein
MAMLKLMNYPVLQVFCDHNGGTQYWCQGCAYEAAAMLRDENVRLRGEINALRDAIPKRPRWKK